MLVIFTKKIFSIFLFFLKNYRKLNFFRQSVCLNFNLKYDKIETVFLSLNGVSMDFKLENRKCGKIPAL